MHVVHLVPSRGWGCTWHVTTWQTHRPHARPVTSFFCATLISIAPGGSLVQAWYDLEYRCQWIIANSLWESWRLPEDCPKLPIAGCARSQNLRWWERIQCLLVSPVRSPMHDHKRILLWTFTYVNYYFSRDTFAPWWTAFRTRFCVCQSAS